MRNDFEEQVTLTKFFQDGSKFKIILNRNEFAWQELCRLSYTGARRYHSFTK